MRLLLDTHSFLWFVLDDPRLSATAKALIADPANEILVSPASHWELAIKIGLKKYSLNKPFEDFIEQGIVGNKLLVLPIEPKHTAALIHLPLHHRDPFDRLLVAQAMVENMPIISVDKALDPYPVVRLW